MPPRRGKPVTTELLEKLAEEQKEARRKEREAGAPAVQAPRHPLSSISIVSKALNLKKWLGWTTMRRAGIRIWFKYVGAKQREAGVKKIDESLGLHEEFAYPFALFLKKCCGYATTSIEKVVFVVFHNWPLFPRCS
eukprot:TRINITY_DN3579_c0_g1_i4.p1 TRINITY_DN3579_c0_g1~~TRINITY_DN3579_c0_g1_i4.p1  ORF type:complete len:136 (+),score=14.89 TRINITY_DN3579_c0_g1_i4:505-912(+)